MRAPRPQRGAKAAVVVRCVLPVSGVQATLRALDGAAELLLAEHRADEPALVRALLARLGETTPRTDWSGLPVHDADTLIARLRLELAGDRVVAEIACARPACGCRVDLSFGLGAYLAHHRPRPARGRGWAAAPCGDADRACELTAAGAVSVRLRLPTLGDQIAVAGAADEAGALAARCLPPDLPAPMRRRAEAALTALAPPLAGPLRGQCPDCGAPIAAWFDARRYCLEDLRARARFVFDDVHMLAAQYHWSERAILRLPQARRAEYAERARLARAA